ncbi:MAG: aspartate--tRNA ligase [Patescibacteria group bacterium]
MLRTHTNGELNKSNAGESVALCGWVHRRRDHGGIIFIDLRDRYGLTQIKFDPDINEAAWKKADSLRSEWVIKASGKVLSRPEDMVNKKLKTGEIEVGVLNLEIMSESKTPPFEIDEEKADASNEALRLKYRFIDLRREALQKLLAKKDKFFQFTRKYFHALGFIEVQTPILANSSPEGARDFLIPSRLYPGKFYALPQAPQQFKQLLMVSGFDRYFQIAPCFRDEDPRMDRHYGEFYQLDMEMSFAEQEDIFKIMEPWALEITKKFSRKKVVGLEADGRLKKIPWREALTKYGIDKPDLRYDLEIKPVTELVKGCGFTVFAGAVESGGVVHALKVDGGAKFTRSQIDELTEVARGKGAKGLAYIVVKSKVKSPKSEAILSGAKLNEESRGNNNETQDSSALRTQDDGDKYELQSPIIKFLGDELAGKIVEVVEAKAGDIVFFGADKWRTVCDALGAVRIACAEKLKLKDKKKAAWCWIVDFPMYDYSEIEAGKIDFGHNPFSMPQGGMEALNSKEPLEILAHQYDLILNGFEVSSGAIRNHEPEIMYKAFEIAGYTREQVDAKFGAMLRAFSYGAPPHGGNAPGVDRIFMALNDLDSIRDIYAFPKDGKGKDLLMDSPSEVDEKQLRDLHVRVKLD